MGLFGIPSPKKETPSAPSDAIVFDVTTADFQDRALKASLEKPVLVDFWAPWCGPCKQLMPVLESEVRAAEGEVLLAKVNIDENPELAQALQIQSVPTVMVFFQGQPVTGFQGARPASEIKSLIAQLVKIARSAKPDALDIPALLKDAADHLANNDVQAAQDLYIQILSQEPENIDAYVGMVRVLIAAGGIEQAQGYVEHAPEGIAKNPGFAAARTALDIALNAQKMSGALGGLVKAVATNPDDHQARFDLASAQFGAGQKGEAIDNLLEIIRKDRGWNDEAARKELLKYFEALGFADPLSVQGRKKLSSVLFS